MSNITIRLKAPGLCHTTRPEVHDGAMMEKQSGRIVEDERYPITMIILLATRTRSRNDNYLASARVLGTLETTYTIVLGCNDYTPYRCSTIQQQ